MTHLSAEQVAQWAAGERTPEIEKHIAACDRCRTEAAGLVDVLAQFRSSVQSIRAPVAVVRRRRVLGPRWALVAAVLVLLVLVPLYRERRARRHAAIEQQDSQLLQQVDLEISRAVPGPMDPLVSLVSSNSNEGKK